MRSASFHAGMMIETLSITSTIESGCTPPAYRASNPSLQWGAMGERVRNVKQHRHVENRCRRGQGRPGRRESYRLWYCVPAKGRFPQTPPEWFGRAAVCGPRRHRIHVLLALVGRHLYLVLDIIISLFLALAVEPLVVALVALMAGSVAWLPPSSFVGVAVVVGCCSRYLATCSYSRWCHGPRLPAMYEQFVSSWTSMPRSRCRKSTISAWKSSTISRPHWVTGFAGTAMRYGGRPVLPSC